MIDSLDYKVERAFNNKKAFLTKLGLDNPRVNLVLSFSGIIGNVVLIPYALANTYLSAMRIMNENSYYFHYQESDSKLDSIAKTTNKLLRPVALLAGLYDFVTGGVIAIASDDPALKQYGLFKTVVGLSILAQVASSSLQSDPDETERHLYKSLLHSIYCGRNKLPRNATWRQISDSEIERVIEKYNADEATVKRCFRRFSNFMPSAYAKKQRYEEMRFSFEYIQEMQQMDDELAQHMLDAAKPYFIARNYILDKEYYPTTLEQLRSWTIQE